MNRIGYNLGDVKNIGSMVKKIVNDAIDNSINAPFIGRVVAIKGNKVDVTPIYTFTFNSIPVAPVIYYNLLVGQQLTGKASVNNPIQIGDIGLCIVTDRDITNYASTGIEGPLNTQRRFSKMDSIFMPLSMHKQDDMAQSYIFTYYGAPKVASLKLEISQNNTISILGGQDGSAFKIDIDDQGSMNVDIGQGLITISLDGNNGTTFTDTNNNNITLDSQGINITDANNNNITLDSQGINVTDANNNNITLDSQGILAKDASGNKLEMTPSSATLTGASGGKVEIGASGITIQGSSGKLMVM